MLDAFETRFQLLEELVRLRLHDSPCRRQPGKRRKSLLKPRARCGIMAPTPRPSPEWHTGRVIHIKTPRGQLKEITLPPSVNDLQRQTLVERTRALLREAEDGTPAPSAKDIRNRLLLVQSCHRPCESRDSDSHVAALREVPSCPRVGSSRESRSERDFP